MSDVVHPTTMSEVVISEPDRVSRERMYHKRVDEFLPCDLLLCVVRGESPQLPTGKLIDG